MAILIREGSVSKDLDARRGLDDPLFVALCTDDRNPLDIAKEGHLDSSIRRLIAKGRPLHHVYRLRAALQNHIRPLTAACAPGWRADIVLLDDLVTCAVPTSAPPAASSALIFAARQPVPPVGLAR